MSIVVSVEHIPQKRTHVGMLTYSLARSEPHLKTILSSKHRYQLPIGLGLIQRTNSAKHDLVASFLSRARNEGIKPRSLLVHRIDGQSTIFLIYNDDSISLAMHSTAAIFSSECTVPTQLRCGYLIGCDFLKNNLLKGSFCLPIITDHKLNKASCTRQEPYRKNYPQFAAVHSV